MKKNFELKSLDETNIDEQDVYLNTFTGRLKITGINRNDWWVKTGRGMYARSWACHPGTIVEVE